MNLQQIRAVGPPPPIDGLQAAVASHDASGAMGAQQPLSTGNIGHRGDTPAGQATV